MAGKKITYREMIKKLREYERGKYQFKSFFFGDSQRNRVRPTDRKSNRLVGV